MADIYEQHRAAFANVSAYVILRDGELVARIAFKFPKDGAGRLYAYVHWIGTEMVRGHASGGGYDKRTAACWSAMACAHRAKHPLSQELASQRGAFYSALALDRGPTWDDQLRTAGFTVIGAV